MARLFADWPTPIVVVGKDVGAAVPFPGSSIATDFAGSPAHPVAEAYKAWKPMLCDAASQAVLAALYATDRKGDLLKLSEPGQIEVLDDGRTRFTPSTTGRHRYLLAGTDSEWKANVVKAFTALASAKPAAPMGRGPRPQQQQQQQAKPPQPWIQTIQWVVRRSGTGSPPGRMRPTGWIPAPATVWKTEKAFMVRASGHPTSPAALERMHP